MMGSASAAATLLAIVTALAILIAPELTAVARAALLAQPSASMRDLGRVSTSDTRVTALAAGTDGKVYAGTSYWGRLIIYDPATGTVTNAGQAVPGGTAIESLVAGSDGLIYGGTNNNAFLFVYSPMNKAFSYPGQVVAEEWDLLSLVATGDGMVYGGTGPNAHLMRFNPKGGTGPQDLGLPVTGETSIMGLTQTGDGLIWATTMPSGLLLALRPDTYAVQVRQSLGATPISLAAFGNNVYVGTTNAELLSFSSTGGLRRLGQPVPGELRIASLVTDGNGNVYGGTYPGAYVFVYEPGQNTFSLLGQPVPGESGVSSLALSRTGVLYAGTSPEGHLAEITFPPPDTTPPSTTISIGSPQFTRDLTYVNSATPFTLSASDSGSGVSHTQYALDAGPWLDYTQPFVLGSLPDGSHTIRYRSQDVAGNLEPERSLRVALDKTPPEASIQFDVSTRDLLVFARDANAIPGSVPVQSLVQSGYIEKRTYLVPDKLNNSLLLEISVQKAQGYQLKAQLTSLGYNGQAAVVPKDNALYVQWILRDDGSVSKLNQQVTVRDIVDVRANYDSDKGSTQVMVFYPGGGKTELSLPGLVTLKLTSDRGELSVKY